MGDLKSQNAELQRALASMQHSHEEELENLRRENNLVMMQVPQYEVRSYDGSSNERKENAREN